jgi:cell division protein FtsW (lipid II flippase)
MIELLRLVLPYLFILYFVVKGIKQPLYLLGIPFLMFMSESIFFEGVKLFRIPGRIEYGLMFFWLGFLWIVSIIFRREEAYNDESQRLNVLDFCIIGLILISSFGLGMTLLNNSIITNVFREFIVLISLFACYFIMKNWSSHNKPELLESFLYSLVIINSIASFLYLLHQGLHLRIYLMEESMTEIINGEEITRTFWFMPQFMFFSIAFCLVQREKSPFVFTVLLIINILATFITYFRSFTIIAVLLFLFYFIIVGLKKGRLGLVVKNIFIYCALTVLGFFILSKLLPANTKFLINRFTELTETSATSGPNNMEYRFIMTNIVISNIDEGKKILGMGPLTENQMSMVRQMREVTADMVWAGVIFRWGFVGLILFILLYIFSIIRAFNIYMKSKGIIADLALMFLLYIISQAFQSFIDWTFMSGHGFAIGLWYFAMLSALIGYNKNTELADEKNV